MLHNLRDYTPKNITYMNACTMRIKLLYLLLVLIRGALADVAVLSSPFELELGNVASDLDVPARMLVESRIVESILEELFRQDQATETELILEDARWLFFNEDLSLERAVGLHIHDNAIIVFRVLIIFRSNDEPSENPTRAPTRFLVDSVVAQTFSLLSSKKQFVESLRNSQLPALENMADVTIDVYEAPIGILGTDDKGNDGDDDNSAGQYAIGIALIAGCVLILCGILLLFYHHQREKRRAHKRYFGVGDADDSLSQLPTGDESDLSSIHRSFSVTGDVEDPTNRTDRTPVHLVADMSLDPHLADTPKATNSWVIQQRNIRSLDDEEKKQDCMDFNVPMLDNDDEEDDSINSAIVPRDLHSEQFDASIKSMASMVSVESSSHDASSMYSESMHSNSSDESYQDALYYSEEHEDILSSMTGTDSLESLLSGDFDDNWFRETATRQALEAIVKDEDDESSDVFHIDLKQYLQSNNEDDESRMSGLSKVEKWLSTVHVVEDDDEGKRRSRRSKRNSSRHRSVESGDGDMVSLEGGSLERSLAKSLVEV